MDRRVAVVLGLTFCALVAATMWVPKRPGINFESGQLVRDASHVSVAHLRVSTWRALPDSKERRWMLVWDRDQAPVAFQPRDIDPALVYRVTPDGAHPLSGWVVDWGRAPILPAVILALGGLIALFVRTRAARGAA